MSNRKNNFIKLVDFLLEQGDDLPEDEFREGLHFWEEFKSNNSNGTLTESGRSILSCMKNNKIKYSNIFTARSLAEELSVNSKSISGSIRKLVNEGYCEKYNTVPISYGITVYGESAI